MNDDEYAELFKPRKPASEASWHDVAREFGELGRTLGDAVRSAWQRQDNEVLRDLQQGLEKIASDIDRGLDEKLATPEAEQAREQLTRLTESIRAAAETTSEQLRPELLALLRQANNELKRITRKEDEPPEP
jgi:predicted ribosome quality control (RQC) complex YloA/Tae2 family protein